MIGEIGIRRLSDLRWIQPLITFESSTKHIKIKSIKMHEEKFLSQFLNMQKQKSERCNKISNGRNILNIIKLSYQKNAFQDTNNLKQNLRQVWLCSLPFVYLQSFYLIKETFFFPSESAHTFSFSVLLSFAMLLLLTASAPLQCLADEKIWKCLDKLPPLSVRISSISLYKAIVVLRYYILTTAVSILLLHSKYYYLTQYHVLHKLANEQF